VDGVMLTKINVSVSI